jgi:hypothetical protein
LDKNEFANAYQQEAKFYEKGLVWFGYGQSQ